MTRIASWLIPDTGSEGMIYSVFANAGISNLRSDLAASFDGTQGRLHPNLRVITFESTAADSHNIPS